MTRRPARLRNEPRPTLWSNSYFVTTVGGAPLAMVKQYIENQQTSERPKEREKWAAYLESLT